MPPKDPDYHKRYYEKHKDEIKEWRQSDATKARRLETQRNRAQRVREYMREIKESSPCVDCNISYPYYVMDFDHVRGSKRWNLATAPRRSLASVKEEIAKCDLVCANCHRVRSHQRLSE